MKRTTPLPAPRESTRPGWYEVPATTATLGFWDGEAWTEHIAPMPTATASAAAPPITLWLIARGVALGMIMASFIAAFLFWVVLSFVNSGDDDCVGPTGDLQACTS